MPLSMEVTQNKSKTIRDSRASALEYDVRDQNGQPATRLVIANVTVPDAVPANDILLGGNVDGGVDGAGEGNIVLWPRSSVVLHGRFSKISLGPSAGTVEFWVQASYN